MRKSERQAWGALLATFKKNHEINRPIKCGYCLKVEPKRRLVPTETVGLACKDCSAHIGRTVPAGPVPLSERRGVRSGKEREVDATGMTEERFSPGGHIEGAGQQIRVVEYRAPDRDAGDIPDAIIGKDGTVKRYIVWYGDGTMAYAPE